MTHITDYGGAIDDYYPARIERIADMELTELEKRADIEAEKSRMTPEVLDGGWQPIETAPKGGAVRKVKCGKRGVREVVEPVVILVPTSDGKITLTYWVEKQERWNMFSKNTPPTHWMPLPEPPK